MSQSYFNLVRRYPQLISYWRLNDAAGSTEVIDFSAHNSLIGSYSGASTPAGSVINENDDNAGSRVFTAAAGASVADIAQLRLTTAFSLEAWIAPTSAAQTATIMGKQNGAIAGPYAMRLAAGVLQVSVGNGTTQVTLAGPTPPVGIPSRVSCSLFRSKLYLCLNGTIWPTVGAVGAQAVTDRGQPLTFGNFVGLMGEVAVYGAALSVLQHQRNFALGRQVISDPSHFIGVDPPVYV